MAAALQGGSLRLRASAPRSTPRAQPCRAAYRPLARSARHERVPWAGLHARTGSFVLRTRATPEDGEAEPDFGEMTEEEIIDHFEAQLDLEEMLLEKSGKDQGVQGTCYGCGAALQTSYFGEAGYVEEAKYLTKAGHRQLKRVLCGRCDLLHNGGMIPAVADFSMVKLGEVGGVPEVADVKRLISPDDLRKQLAEVRTKKALVVKVVDMLDVSGSFLRRVRDLVGGNPIVLIATKSDLLPKKTDHAEVVDWLWALTERKKLNVVDVVLVSSKTGDGVSKAAAAILSQRRGRDVYVLGAANVGKSAFVNAMLREMKSFSSRHFDPMATNAARTQPTESAMPGTTLGTIALQAFASGGSLYDTPGVHLHHRVSHILTPQQLAGVHPRRKLRHFVPGPPGASKGAAEWEEVGGPEGCSFMWGGLARVDVVSAPPSTRLAFYGPPAMRVEVRYADELMSPEESSAADEAAARAEAGGWEATWEPGMGEGERGADRPPPAPSPSEVGAWEGTDGADGRGATQGGGGDEVALGESVAKRGGLRVARQVSVPARAGGPGGGALADIDVSGLAGWVAVHAWPEADLGADGDVPLRLRVWAPVGVEVFVRPPLPVPGIRPPRGAGARDLDEMAL